MHIARQILREEHKYTATSCRQVGAESRFTNDQTFPRRQRTIEKTYPAHARSVRLQNGERVAEEGDERSTWQHVDKQKQQRRRKDCSFSSQE